MTNPELRAVHAQIVEAVGQAQAALDAYQAALAMVEHELSRPPSVGDALSMIDKVAAAS